MPTRQPASFNATFSRIAALRAACVQLGGATREKALFIVRHGPPRPSVLPRGLARAFLGTVVVYHRAERAQAVEPSEMGISSRLRDSGAERRPRHWTWAALMRRAFDLDVLRCPRCAGRMQLIATIDDPAVIQRILAHLGLPGARDGLPLPPLVSTAPAEQPVLPSVTL
jgi:hypothetical protein